MLDDLNELRTLQQVFAQRSFTAAARALGVSLAVVSKRIATLEKRVGLRLVNRTSRSLSPTEEGARLMVDVDRALETLRQAEEVLATGRNEPFGTLRVSAPVSLGRRHVVPVVGRLAQLYPRLSISLSLDDQLVDIAGGGVDVAIRIGEGVASAGAITRKLADNHRILLASPAYLDLRGRPRRLEELAGHELLRYGDAIGPWRFVDRDGAERLVSVSPRLRVNNGDAIHDLCVAGVGIMLKSDVDAAVDLRRGALERVLPEWRGSQSPIIALFPDRTTLPRKTRVFLDAMVGAMM